VTSENLRILHVGKYFPPFNGGIENFMSSLIEAQYSLGHDVAAICHHHTIGLSTQTSLHKGIEVCRVRNLGVFAFVPISPSFGYHLKTLVNRIKPDVVHVHMPNVSAFWLLLWSKRKLGFKLVIHWHSDVLGDKPTKIIKCLYPIYRVFENALLKKSDHIIATSPEYAITSVPLSTFQNKVCIVPLGLSDCESVNTDMHRNQQLPLRLLCVGRLTYYKAHRLLLASFADILSKYPEVSLDIVGEGELKDQLFNFSMGLKLSASVTFHGEISDEKLIQLYADCDILCLPSIERTEAFGLVILEAAKNGMPAIVSDVKGSGMSYVVNHEDTGLVVKSNNVESLVSAIEQFIINPKLISIYGANAYKRFKTEFSLRKITKEVLAVYESN
jgi:rhamnosyl/mannosyltransferase